MKTILVVDDENAIRMLIEAELVEEGYRVLTANNAQDALKMVQTEPLDLVILDIRMPGMDGLEALPRILGLKEGIKVILNTAYSQYQDSSSMVSICTFCTSSVGTSEGRNPLMTKWIHGSASSTVAMSRTSWRTGLRRWPVRWSMIQSRSEPFP